MQMVHCTYKSVEKRRWLTKTPFKTTELYVGSDRLTISPQIQNKQ